MQPVTGQFPEPSSADLKRYREAMDSLKRREAMDSLKPTRKEVRRHPWTRVLKDILKSILGRRS